MNKLLGIYIPAYNRPKELEECMRSFIAQVRGYGFPIYISDNSAADDTGRMVKRLKKDYPYIYYHKNAKNVTYPPNVDRILKMGDTEYAWLFADDDDIYPDAIEKIVENLKQGYDYLILNADVYSKNLKNKIKDAVLPPERDMIFKKGEYEKALLLHGRTGYQGFNPHMVMRKSIMDKEIGKIDPYAPNMDFIHTIIYYRGIVGKKGKFIAKPLIKNRGGNWWYSIRIMEIFFKSWYLTHSMLKKYYSKRVLDEVRDRSIIDLCIPITIDKLLNRSNPGQTYAKYIESNRNIPQSYKPILKLVMYAPRQMHALLYESYRRMKRY